MTELVHYDCIHNLNHHQNVHNYNNFNQSRTILERYRASLTEANSNSRWRPWKTSELHLTNFSGVKTSDLFWFEVRLRSKNWGIWIMVLRGTNWQAPSGWMHFGRLVYECMYIQLGVRSLANASRAGQFNPLNDQNPPGVGRYRFLKQIWQPWSIVRGRAWSCTIVGGRARRSCGGRARSSAVERGRARSCLVGGRAWSCVVVRGRAWSCVAVVRGGRARSYVVVRGRAWSSLTAVLPASRPALPWRTDGHTDGQHIIPP